MDEQNPPLEPTRVETGDDPGTTRQTAPFLAGEEIGATLGPYRLVQVLGEGGCGSVYLAEQERPVRRRVALKLIKLGMDTRAVMARFELERQALAMMDHPNIARVLDAGTTPSGRPYFVMELVKGVRITDYCDQNHLSPEERLRLFLEVCHAIQHAHQKGIVHRDIKPSNILVTLQDDKPVPKVIDFGIAKATDQALAGGAIFTAVEQFIGTPAYMSPEQAQLGGLDIDTRSDIYSLGVLLYELLTGRTPLDAETALKAGIDEVRRRIREDDPPKPSTTLQNLGQQALTEMAHRRRADAPRLIHAIKGDLDCIVLKCLEKDRTRRYDTANALAADIEHFLRNEPVQARPAGQLYRLKKLISRNKAISGAIALAGLALIAAFVISIWQSLEKTKAYNRVVQAEKEQTRLRVKAEEAHRNEQRLRSQAQQARKDEEALRRRAQARAYAADIGIAQRAIELNNFGRARDLLDRHKPAPGEQDRRGWEWRFLWQQCRSDAEFSIGKSNEWIQTLSVSHDGQYVAAAERERPSLKVWDLRTRDQIASLSPVELVLKTSFSPAAPILAAGSYAGAGENFSLFLHSFPGSAAPSSIRLPQEDYCAGLGIAADGKTMAVLSHGEIAIRELPGGAVVRTYPAEKMLGFRPQDAEFSKDLAYAAVNHSEEGLTLLHLPTQRRLWTKQPTDKYFTAAAFSPNNKFLVTAVGYVESSARVWEVESGREVQTLEGHNAYILNAAFSPDGRILATSSADQTIRLWNTADWSPLETLRGHRLEVWRVAWLPDNKRLVSGAKDGAILVWNIKNLRRDRTYLSLPGPILDWAFSPEGQALYTVRKSGTILRWSGTDFSEGSPILDIGKEITSAAFARDASLLSICVSNQLVQVWNIPRKGLLAEKNLFKENGAIYRFSPEKRLLTFDRDRVAFRVLDGSSLDEIKTIPIRRQAGAVDLADDRYLLAHSTGPSLFGELFSNSETNVQLRVHGPGDVAFSPDGARLAIANKFGFARVWDTRTWKETLTCENFLKGVHSVGWSPDSKRLAVASGDKEAIKLWDTESGEELLTLEASGGLLAATKFSPDGNVLTSLDEKSSLHIWRAPSLTEVRAEEQ